MGKFNESDWLAILGATHAGMTDEEFTDIVRHWIETAKHPRFKRLYSELVYQPMLEVMNLLHANGFRTYIVTGGGQDFVRAYAQRVYGVPPERVKPRHAIRAKGG
jgi:phosphoserine phosphatase